MAKPKGDKIAPRPVPPIHPTNLNYEYAPPPAGVVTLMFSGGAALRLQVECIEAQIADLGSVWEAAACPCHLDDDAGSTPPQERRMA